MSFDLKSDAFSHEGSIPAQYTCEGDDISPPLKWSHAPSGCKSFVLIVDDPDAPDPKAPKMTYVHWVLYNIPSSATELPEDCDPKHLPKGTLQGLNDWGRTGYGGPCPPIGRHRYFFKLYALDTLLNELPRPTKAELLKAMQGHVLGESMVMGTYQKVK